MSALAPPSAAIFYIPDGYDASLGPKIGRRVAGEEFLRAVVRHSGFARLNAVVRFAADGEAFTRQVEALGATVPAGWALHEQPGRIDGMGAVMLPGPGLGQYVWQRRRYRQNAYSLVGITHTLCTAGSMDDFASLLVAPTQRWDALICTSRAARDVVFALMREQASYLRDRFGAQRVEGPQLPVIPLGVDCEALQPPPGLRALARQRLGMAEQDVVALVLARLSHTTKFNPLATCLALGRAGDAAPPGARLHLLLAGRFDPPNAEEVFRGAAAALCPNVTLHVMEAETAAQRHAAFAAADLFTLLVDNIQESFGLAPIEAMAVGLPPVVSDWDGFRDTVQDGVTGFRVPTLIGTQGGDMAARFAAGADTYARYAASVGQFVAVDVAAAEAAFGALIGDPERRRRMGEAGRAHARATFDWSVVMRQYLELWDELGRLRASGEGERAPRQGGEAVPTRPDPLRLFRGFASSQIEPGTRLVLAEGASPTRLRALMAVPGAVANGVLLPPVAELDAVLNRLAEGPATAAEAVAPLTGGRAVRLMRGIAWLAKLGLIRLAG